MDWKEFNFFHERINSRLNLNIFNNEVNNEKITENLVDIVSGGGNIIFGMKDGTILIRRQQFGKDVENDESIFETFVAHYEKMEYIRYIDIFNYLISLGKTETEENCIKIWNCSYRKVSTTKQYLYPILTTLTDKCLNETNNRVTSIDMNSQFLVIGKEKGEIYLCGMSIEQNETNRLNLTKFRSFKRKFKSIFKGKSSIVSLDFSPTKTGCISNVLFVGMKKEIVSLKISSGEYFVEELDNFGVENCHHITKISHSATPFMVGNESGLYFYVNEGRGSCLAFGGRKEFVYQFNSTYLVVIYCEIIEKETTILEEKKIRHYTIVIYDIHNHYIILKKFLKNNRVIGICYEWNQLYLICENGKIFSFVEMSFRKKLEYFFQYNLYSFAIDLTKQQKSTLHYKNELMQIYRQYADTLLEKKNDNVQQVTEHYLESLYLAAEICEKQSDLSVVRHQRNSYNLLKCLSANKNYSNIRKYLTEIWSYHRSHTFPIFLTSYAELLLFNELCEMNEKKFIGTIEHIYKLEENDPKLHEIIWKKFEKLFVKIHPILIKHHFVECIFYFSFILKQFSIAFNSLLQLLDKKSSTSNQLDENDGIMMVNDHRINLENKEKMLKEFFSIISQHYSNENDEKICGNAKNFEELKTVSPSHQNHHKHWQVLRISMNKLWILKDYPLIVEYISTIFITSLMDHITNKMECKKDDEKSDVNPFTEFDATNIDNLLESIEQQQQEEHVKKYDENVDNLLYRFIISIPEEFKEIISDKIFQKIFTEKHNWPTLQYMFKSNQYLLQLFKQLIGKKINSCDEQFSEKLKSLFRFCSFDESIKSFISIVAQYRQCSLITNRLIFIENDHSILHRHLSDLNENDISYEKLKEMIENNDIGYEYLLKFSLKNNQNIDDSMNLSMKNLPLSDMISMIGSICETFSFDQLLESIDQQLSHYVECAEETSSSIIRHQKVIDELQLQLEHLNSESTTFREQFCQHCQQPLDVPACFFACGHAFCLTCFHGDVCPKCLRTKNANVINWTANRDLRRIDETLNNQLNDANSQSERMKILYKFVAEDIL
ncbi:hypothetical protein SNEBB_007487 [Seison nebaliae]|nr:hypothetical protein SNEBB_007487 [Seison nebaliae]